MSSVNFSRGPNGDLIYYPKACQTEPTSKGDPTKWLEVKHEGKDYRPEEICIKVTHNMGKIEGNHKTKFASKSFYKEFIIPSGVNIEKLDISLSAKGFLSIFAPIGMGVNTSGTTSVSEKTKQSVQSQSKVSQTESNKAVSSATETIKKIRQQNVSEFSFDELNNSRIEDISKPIQKVEQGNVSKKFEVDIEVPDFAPEDIQIRVTKTTVTIIAKREIREQNRVSIEQIFKKFTIPTGIRPEDITSTLQTNGVLRITNGKTSTKPQQPAVTNKGQEVTTAPSPAFRPKPATVAQKQDSATPVSALPQRPNEDVGKVIPSVNLNTEVNNEELRSHEDLTNVIRKVKEENKLEVDLDVSNFKRDEVKVTIYKRTVIIEARNKTTTKTTTLLKKFTIPDGVRPEQISCDINPSGILTITAPSDSTAPVTGLPQRPSEDVGKVIPTVDLITEVNNEEFRSHEDLTNVIRKVEDGKKIEVNLNVSDFKRDEVNIEIYRRIVIIEVRKRTTTTTTTTTTTKSLLKKLTIPDGVRPDQISCDINSSGILTITAPLAQNIQNITDSKVSTDLRQKELQKQVDRSKNLAETRNTQTTSKKARSLTLKTNIVTAESLSGYDFENAISTVYDLTGRTVFEESVEINEYRPEDIEIKMAYNVQGFNIVIVEGNQEMTKENGYKSKSFHQMFSVPEGVKLETIECTMDLDENNSGLLTCTAPIEHK